MDVKQTKVEEYEGLKLTAKYIIRATTPKEVRCLRCNRVLTNSLSRWRKYGPVCWKQLQETTARFRMKPLKEAFKNEFD